MTRTVRGLVAAVVAAALAAALWWGWRQSHRPAAPAVVQEVPDDTVPAVDTVETVNTAAATIVTAGTTPMRERVAVVGLLNKRNGESRDLTLKPGQAIRVGDVAVHLRACERTAPWEPDQLTGAFVQLDVRGADRHWRRVFSGWLYKEQPSLNVVLHPIYDVWAKSCTMSFPATGPDTETLAPPRSSAAKSPTPAVAEDEAPATTPDNASPSAAR